MSAVTLKCPVKGGPILAGRVWGSTCFVHVSKPGAKNPRTRNPYLVIDETPLFQKGVHAHDRTNIAGQVPPTRGYSQVFDGVQSVRIDHEITIVLVHGGGFAAIPAVEELW